MRGEMVAFAVRSGRGLVEMGCFVMEFGGSVVRALGHDMDPPCRWMQMEN
jgi:hypothetical protein